MSRRDFIPSKKPADYDPLVFLGNYVADIDHYGTYLMLITGTTTIGERVGCLIHGIHPKIRIKCPERMIPEAFIAALRAWFEFRMLNSEAWSVEQWKDFKYDGPEHDYIVLQFKSKSEHSKFVKHIKSERFPGTGEFLTTSCDDETSYYNCVMREWDIRSSDWIRITGRHEHSKQLTNCDYAYNVYLDEANHSYEECRNLARDRPIINVEIPPTRQRVLVASFDIETMNFVTGETFDVATEAPENECFMVAISFYWANYRDILAKYNISMIEYMPPPGKGTSGVTRICCKTIGMLYDKVVEILVAYKPEVITGFNDGNFDWPFIYNHMNDASDFTRWSHLVAGLRVHAGWGEEKLATRHIKISAEDSTTVRIPDIHGLLCVDMMVQLRRANPLDKEWGLSYFLKKYGLGDKHDMDYIIMNRTYCCYWVLSAGGTRNPIAELAKADNLDATIGNACKGWPARFKRHITYVSGLRLSEARDLLMDAYRIHDYCDYDAEGNYKLMQKSSLMLDKREFCILSYVSLPEGIFKADGCKVRNTTIAVGNRPEWRLAISNTKKLDGSGTNKYPGAIVLEPEKGWYKNDLLTKLQLRKDKSTGTVSSPGTCQPGHPDFNRELLDYALVLPSVADEDYESHLASKLGEFRKRYPIPPEYESRLEYRLEADRPHAGLDGSSLYPNEAINGNASPDKCLRPGITPDERELLRKSYESRGIEFRTKVTEFEFQGKTVRAEFVQNYIGADGKLVNMGLYPFILSDLFNRRSRLKKQLGVYASKLEFIQRKLGNTTSITKDEIESRLDKEIADRQAAYDRNPKKFNKMMLDDIRALKVAIMGDLNVIIDDCDTGISNYFDDIEFTHTYLDAKQKALKVFMNTFYGEAGNQKSPFFIVEVSGAITTGGRNTIQSAKAFAEKRGYRVAYGDTDSNYVRCRELTFRALDYSYYTSAITKIQYWESMIELTMENLDTLKSELNSFLKAKNEGKEFLKMEYEEVLFPVAFLGKKKYIGVQHMRMPDIGICNCEIKVFKSDYRKKLFIRGLNMKTRQSSQILKDSNLQVLHAAFNIWSYSTMEELIYNNIDYVRNSNFPIEMYYKNAKYNAPRAGGTGNRTVLAIIDRMRKLRAIHPFIYIPDMGERFNYVIIRRATEYTITGTKMKSGVGDRSELAKNIANPEYLKVMGLSADPGELIDIDYYITGEIIGQLSRFISYMYMEADLDYKEADKLSVKAAKRDLRDYYSGKFMTRKPVNRAPAKQFKDANRSLIGDLAPGRDLTFFSGLGGKVYGSDASKYGGMELYNALIALCEKKYRRTEFDLDAYMKANNLTREEARNKLKVTIPSFRTDLTSRLNAAKAKLISLSGQLAANSEHFRSYIRAKLDDEQPVIADTDARLVSEIEDVCMNIKAYLSGLHTYSTAMNQFSLNRRYQGLFI